MEKRLILYDFGPEDRQAEGPDGQDHYFPAQPLVAGCLGCFGCWVKTPGRCVIQDRASLLPGLMKECQHYLILSPILYGGYSVCVKRAMERCLGYLQPYLRIVQGEMHHKLRYDHPFRLTVWFYGPCGPDQQETARQLVRANGLNLGAACCEVRFFDSKDQVKEALGWKF